ncbi:putative tRNA sulfurtransferase ThiI [Gottschalkia acidurici 9a]|uniref:Probable tRNA sulfurtransferase n=1 Tax=Gottschalkia acidurici (strain ATCC 7906 / DSM 604 / BCRC 14475 / CIP 104303 / KCTC 5404 / NCIMB 10678 / 9a) TaxID=1128398 RepID=K0AZ44_GOTA9|nr:tRNA uracil 4-sulfurtransferase ThiI [Gottschalkia acidurici]AFS77960.1 putative tRNA sulfurtransferase ThiI [Gottschalkia acidurici 9a]
MERVISVSFGEIALKGLNKSYFEDKLIKNIRSVIKDLGESKIYKEQGKVYIEIAESSMENAMNRIKKVFGIVYVSPCLRIEKNEDMEEVKKYAILALKEALEESKNRTYKVETKRADKNFPMKSPEISREIGGYLLENVEDVTVDVHKPDIVLNIDIRKKCYIYTRKIKAYGGLPIGTNGRGLLLLSGGIDSPVAGFMMAKRGLGIDAVHFHSYPFTSERSEEKVKDLAGILSRYCGNITVYSVNLLNIQKEINKNCPEKEMTLISRRFMMRIAESIAKKNGLDALITGESLGQVASQTIKGLTVTNSSVEIPVFRPLIGMDKVDITEIAQDIETFETSIQPFEDCCTVFLPKHPVTRPEVEDIEKSEEALNTEELINDAIENMEIYNIKQ